MLKKLTAGALSVVALTSMTPVFANDDMNSCKIEVAVSTPPVALDMSVVFNLTTANKFNKSITLKGGSAPQFLENLPCSEVYTITATTYTTPSNTGVRAETGIGQCTLRAGQVAMNGPENSISVVFPNDFICNA